MKIIVKVFLLIWAIQIIVSCTIDDSNGPKSEYEKSIDEWHNKRIERLKKENGWLNLVGLIWINEGENKFGSDPDNDIVFPEGKAEKFMGTVVKKDSVITINVEPGLKITQNNKPVSSIKMIEDIKGNPTILEYKSLRWFIIKRGDKYGIRLRDLESDLLLEFGGIERFPVKEDWKIEANFHRYESPKKIFIPTILGTVEEDYSPGKLLFNIGEKEFTLEPTSAGKGLFIVFADLTSGEETYGAGRFLYTDGPDSNNIVILDFNKAYNPPCAFTKYATCPLPPDENKLRVRIEAGEKNYGDH